MSDFEIDWSDVPPQELALARFGAMIGNLLPFWPKLVPLFIGWMREQFESEGAYGGDPWAPLTPEYAARKAEMYPGKGILVATGELRGAASRPQRVMTPTALILRVDDSGTSHGSVLPFHQAGTTRMPARPLLFERLSAPALAQVERAAEEYVEEALRVSGLGR